MGQRSRIWLTPSFGRLWGAAILTNSANGVARAAVPLLMLSVTRDPKLIAGAGIAVQLPWLVTTLPLGALIDRADRRRVLMLANVVRGVTWAALAAAVAADSVSIPLLYVAFFILGVGEVATDNGAVALVPSLVEEEQLEEANARMTGAFVLVDHLAGPPLGAALFAASMAVPFGYDALAFLLAAALVSTIATPRAVGSAAPEARRSFRADLREGFRTLWGNATLRLLALVLGVMNVLFGIGFAVYVLYATDRLGLSEVGFGFLLAGGAVGGVVGSVLAARLRDLFGVGTLLRAGLVLETGTHLVLAWTTSAWVAGVVMALFGVHAIVWGVMTISIRQRVTPNEVLGRVNSVNQFLGFGGMALGTLVGGVVADLWAVETPFWVAGVGMVLVTVLVFGRIGRVAVAPAVTAPDGPSGSTTLN